MLRKKVYIAGPYTQGDVAVNVRTAITMADVLMRYGFAPYVPHLNHFWNLAYPRPREDWMTLDFAWLVHCDALLRLPGASLGADREVARAQTWGIPVYETLEVLLKAEQEGV